MPEVTEPGCPMKADIWCDGAARKKPNPGLAGAGYIIIIEGQEPWRLRFRWASPRTTRRSTRRLSAGYGTRLIEAYGDAPAHGFPGSDGAPLSAPHDPGKEIDVGASKLAIAPIDLPIRLPCIDEKSSISPLS